MKTALDQASTQLANAEAEKQSVMAQQKDLLEKSEKLSSEQNEKIAKQINMIEEMQAKEAAQQQTITKLQEMIDQMNSHAAENGASEEPQ